MAIEDNLTIEETRNLVFHMGIKLNTLDDIAANYKEENKRQHFVKAWLDKTTNASWDTLVTGLRRVKKNTLAAEIESKYLPKPQASSNGSCTLLPCSPAVPISVPPESARVDPLSHPNQSLEQRVAVATSKDCLQGEFSDSEFVTQQSLSKITNYKCVCKFREHLPVAKKQIHFELFTRNEHELLAAETVQNIVKNVGQYCRYEIIFNIVNRSRFYPEIKPGTVSDGMHS